LSPTSSHHDFFYILSRHSYSHLSYLPVLSITTTFQDTMTPDLAASSPANHRSLPPDDVWIDYDGTGPEFWMEEEGFTAAGEGMGRPQTPESPWTGDNEIWIEGDEEYGEEEEEEEDESEDEMEEDSTDDGMEEDCTDEEMEDAPTEMGEEGKRAEGGEEGF
ncbi:hypothetical protein BZA05DRAFT_461321, partial [Tricharina praecox]|uniref:uncharacterized protein n=1 Tax=Tricharina praecox TaxID=43433 RepID=UPI002220CB4B